MSEADQTIRSGEPPLIAFVSSVMNDELRPAREIVERMLLKPEFLPWLFEHTPASSENMQESYLQKVREATFVFWLVGRRTTEPVEKEIREALAAQRRLIVLKLPAEERDAATHQLLEEVRERVRYSEVASLDDLPRQVDLAVGDEIKRALKDRPGMSRVARLEELSRASRARCLERWQVAGVEAGLALDLADDIAVGAAPELVLPDADRPLRVLGGDLGAGKSLAGERFHQTAIAAHLADASAPIPVYVRARDATDGLEARVIDTAEGLGDPRLQGATVVLDGIDEPGLGAAADLVQQARILSRTWPQTRILITSRPLSVIEDVGELVALPSLTNDQASELVGRIAGIEVTPGREAGWPANLRAAIRLPLFAVLFGTYLRRNQGQIPGSRGELLRGLVESAIGRVGENVRPLLRKLAVLSLARRGGPVPEGEVARPSELEQLENTRLVVAGNHTLVFPLIVIAQWFAAESIVEGVTSPDEVIAHVAQLEDWRYPLAIAVGTYSYGDVTRILGPLASTHAGFASQIVEEGLAKWSTAEDVLPPTALECGRQVRAATEHWVTGIESVKDLLWPAVIGGRLRPLGAHVSGHHLTTAWYIGESEVPEVTELPQSLSGFLSPGQDSEGWVSIRDARPGRQAAWAWRWSFEQVRRALEGKLKRRSLVLYDTPLADAQLWAVCCSLLNLGFLHGEPIAIGPFVGGIPEEADAAVAPNGRRVRTTGFVRPLRERLERGEAELQPPFPGPDQPLRSGFVWDPWSEERLIDRVRAVYETALRGYRSLTSGLFASLAPWMQMAVTLPARLRGYVQPTNPLEGIAGGPLITWWLEALPSEQDIDVALLLTHEDRREESAREFRRSALRSRELRPAQAHWLDSTLRSSYLEVFDLWAAQELVYHWLWDDLKRIRWVDGLLGARPTGFGDAL